MKLSTLNPSELSTAERITQLWNAACGPDLSISERFARYNLEPAAGAELAVCEAELDGQRAGFVVASATLRPVAGLEHPAGWVEALAVRLEFQGRGLGSRLLSWAEAWLAERGCRSIRLGGGLRPFAPGLPIQLASEPFFTRRGFQLEADGGRVWDMAGLLGEYRPRRAEGAPPATVQPLQAGEEAELEAFFTREFPGRWRFEFQEHIRQNGRREDYLVLRTAQGVDGFCQVTFEDSLRPLDRFYMHGLPRPWGQLGPIGVSDRCRGQGLGGFLLDAGLTFLRARGVAGCVIDWTHLKDFYQKFGFYPHREYHILHKELSSHA
jgi:predicted N-acetyltransferase YhbS